MKKPRVQRKPLIAISSDEDDDSSVHDTNERKVEQISMKSSADFHFTSFQDSLSDANEEEEVYDWLETGTSSEQDSDHSTVNPMTPSRVDEMKTRRINFSPPGCDSPLFEIQSTMEDSSRESVKDTNLLRKKKAQLPSEKPQVVKGSWLTNRIVLNNYILLESLGKGSYGEVVLCKDRKTNKLFAMKIMKKTAHTVHPKPPNPGNINYNDDVRREVAIMKKLRDDSVVRLYEVIDDPRSSTIYLVLEYMKRGDLMQIIRNQSMNDEQTWDILRQVIRGLNYLHLNNIVHGDMKPSNLLVAGDGRVKLGDFGISRIKFDGELLDEHMGTPAFMAPEIISGVSYDGKLADIYSVGATAYCIRFGDPPFKARSRQDLYQQILNNPVRFEVESSATIELKRLIQELMVKTPSHRITMEKLILYPWLQVRPNRKKDLSEYRIEGSFNSSVCSESNRVEVTNLDIFNSISSMTAHMDLNS